MLINGFAMADCYAEWTVLTFPVGIYTICNRKDDRYTYSFLFHFQLNFLKINTDETPGNNTSGLNMLFCLYPM